jgi:hypothetical protein
MIVQAPANMNKSALLAHFEQVTTIYIKQYGAGNLRLAGNPTDLDSTIGQAIQDGIVQVTAQGWVQYFWEGDLWWISDAAGAVVMVVPSYQFYIDRLKHRGVPNQEVMTLNEAEGDLSTYR